MKTEHINNSVYTVLFGNYYAVVDLDEGSVKNVPKNTSEETLDEIYDTAQAFHIERLRSESEEPDGYKKFGLNENEFIGI